MKPLAHLAMVATLLNVAACSDGNTTEPEPSATRRETIQSFHTTISKVRNASNEWYEVAIAVDGSNSFAMPVFFMSEGQFVQLSDEAAAKQIDQWLKERAEGVAAFGAFGQQFGEGKPFVAIDVERAE